MRPAIVSSLAMKESVSADAFRPALHPFLCHPLDFLSQGHLEFNRIPILRAFQNDYYNFKLGLNGKSRVKFNLRTKLENHNPIMVTFALQR